MPIFEEFLILGYQSKELVILDYTSIKSNTIPDYLKNISIMCLSQEFNYQKEKELQKMVDDFNTKNYLHQFILTDQNGCRRYCTSLVIFEQNNTELYVPFVYVIVSQQSNLISQKQYMTTLYNGVFDRYTRYRDRGWTLQQKKLKNQQLIEFYLSLGLSHLDGIYYLPKQQTMGNRQEVIHDMLINNPKYRNNLHNKDVCFKTLFSKLSINSVIKIIQSIILEKQLILFTQQVWDLANITEALLQFIYPLQWRCIYIPYLPKAILDTLHASVPYIIGVHSDQKEKILTQFDCVDKILIDLDNDRVIGTNISFPEQLTEHLVYECEQLNKSYLYDDKQLIKLQSIFLKFQLQLINNILPYFIYSDENYNSIEDIFQKDLYIQLFTQIDQEFYREFINRTMMFPRLIEECYKILYQTEFIKNIEQKSDITLYLQLIKNTNQNENSNKYELFKKPFILMEKLLQTQNQQLKEIETEISSHQFFPKYLTLIQNSEFENKQFPVSKIDKKKIVLIDIIAEQKQQPNKLKQNINDVCNEDKPQLFFSFIPIAKIPPKIQMPILSNYTKQLIINYPKQIQKQKKIKQLSLTPQLKNYSQNHTNRQLMSVRSTKRIFNIEESGYQSMYRTKTYNSLRVSKY